MRQRVSCGALCLFLNSKFNVKKLLTIIVVLVLCMASTWAQDTPYISGTSSLKIYSTDGSVGMMIEPWVAPDNDTLSLKGGDYITVTAKTLDSYYVVSGKLALALTRGNEIVEILGTKTISSISAISFVYFSCKIDEETVVMSGDEIRLLTSYNDILYNTVDAAYGNNVTDRIPAVNYALPLCKINYPSSVEGVTIRPSDEQAWPDKTVKGRNFYLYITKDNPDDVLVVKVNGNSWVESDGVYMLNSVMQDCDVEIKLYTKEECDFYKIIIATSDERVEQLLTAEELDYTKGLKVKGEVKAEDFIVFRDKMPSLEILDLREAVIENNYLPESAFDGNATLTEIFLPEGLEGLSNNAFRHMKKLKQIVLPKTLNIFGYNAFFGCESLKKVWVKWNPIEAGIEPLQGFPIPPCAFRATTYKSDGTLIVPKGCVDAYKGTANWGDFKTIRQEAPVDFLLELPFEYFIPKESGLNEAKNNSWRVHTTKGECTIIQSQPDSDELMITDMSGRICKRMKLTEQMSVVPLRAGCYIVTLAGKSRKIVVP